MKMSFLLFIGCIVAQTAVNAYGPLQHALMPGEKIRIEELAGMLSSGANVNDPHGYCGRTPIYYAIERGRLDVVELFLRAGASLEWRDSTGKTPCEFAKLRYWARIVALLEAWRAKLAFCGVRHNRIGAESPFHTLPICDIQHILSFIGPEQFIGHQ